MCLRPYSRELRLRIVQAYEKRKGSLRPLVSRFRVSLKGMSCRGRPAALPPAIFARFLPERSMLVEGQDTLAGKGSPDAGSLGAGHRRSARSGHQPGCAWVVYPCGVLYCIQLNTAVSRS